MSRCESVILYRLGNPKNFGRIYRLCYSFGVRVRIETVNKLCLTADQALAISLYIAGGTL